MTRVIRASSSRESRTAKTTSGRDPAAERGQCVQATENFYYGSCNPSMPPRLTRACLCDNTQKDVLLDCSGVHEAFRNLGDCE